MIQTNKQGNKHSFQWKRKIHLFSVVAFRLDSIDCERVYGDKKKKKSSNDQWWVLNGAFTFHMHPHKIQITNFDVSTIDNLQYENPICTRDNFQLKCCKRQRWVESEKKNKSNRFFFSFNKLGQHIGDMLTFGWDMINIVVCFRFGNAIYVLLNKQRSNVLKIRHKGWIFNLKMSILDCEGTTLNTIN